MGTIELDEMPAVSGEDGRPTATSDADDGVDRLPELVAALVTYANKVERLHARMRFSADQGDRMMEQLGISPEY